MYNASCSARCAHRDNGVLILEDDVFSRTELLFLCLLRAAGHELDGGGAAQEQLVQSAWTSSAGTLPWELDSSISPENREAIQKMLQEEQYPFNSHTSLDIHTVKTTDLRIQQGATTAPVCSLSDSSVYRVDLHRTLIKQVNSSLCSSVDLEL
ncbi:hypothetical protein F2P81_005894 [Scophthalmus maximus]|uniref:Uncharacterized protein n=1 Tax=Scophthalmus maximus TaxID=52904 RepID=A0A6A4TJW4_SCOMX|nr:hypothetical protein F2P81_005894 [Scophthalmus maximus]